MDVLERLDTNVDDEFPLKRRIACDPGADRQFTAIIPLTADA